MTVRIVGAALIAAASVAVGAGCVGIWERRVRQLGAFCRLLGALRDGIAILGLPLSQIVSRFSDGVLEESGYLPYLRTALGGGEYGAFSEGLRRCRGTLVLEEGEMTLLLSCFDALGTEDSGRECARCEYCLARLQALYDEAAAALPARSRIAKTLSAAAGGVTVLLLL
ncbi:MAG: hypothetical protein IJ302_00165 [Clostridia bacterium]|nr:hypothetical protein [Clostridia bacterium]